MTTQPPTNPGWFTFPAPVTPTPPAGASTHPGHLTALPAATKTTGAGRTGSGTNKTAASTVNQPASSSHTGLIAALVAVVVILAAGSVLVARRRRRSPALAPTGAAPGATAFRTPPPAEAEPTPVPTERTDQSTSRGGPPEPADQQIDDHSADDHSAGIQGAGDLVTGDTSGEQTPVDISAPRPTVLPDPVTPPVPVPSVRVLGQVRVDGFVDLPGQGPLVDLLVFRAVHPDRAFLTDTLRGRLATGDDTEVAEATMYSYVSRLRRHLPDGVELINSRAGYRLVGVTTDLAMFNARNKPTDTIRADQTTLGDDPADPDVEAITSVSSALALIDGVPFDTERTARWVSEETVRGNTQNEIVATARRLDDLASRHGWHDRVLWGYHQAALAAPTDQALAADSLTAAARHPRPAMLHQEWQRTLDRLAAEAQTPTPDLVHHYQNLTRHLPG